MVGSHGGEERGIDSQLETPHFVSALGYLRENEGPDIYKAPSRGMIARIRIK